MSIILNNNASILEKENHLTIHDRERRVSVVETTENIEGVGATLTKVISFNDDANQGENEEEEDNYYTTFVPTVSCDSYDSVNVYGHNIQA